MKQCGEKFHQIESCDEKIYYKMENGYISVHKRGDIWCTEIPKFSDGAFFLEACHKRAIQLGQEMSPSCFCFNLNVKVPMQQHFALSGVGRKTCRMKA